MTPRSCVRKADGAFCRACAIVSGSAPPCAGIGLLMISLSGITDMISGSAVAIYASDPAPMLPIFPLPVRYVPVKILPGAGLAPVIPPPNRRQDVPSDSVSTTNSRSLALLFSRSLRGWYHRSKTGPRHNLYGGIPDRQWKDRQHRRRI